MDSLNQIAGIGPKTIEKLHRLNISTPQHLLYHFPHRYIDFRQNIPIAQASAQANQNVTITGRIKSFQNIYTKNGKNLQIAKVADSTGRITLMWFNQPYLAKTLKQGQTYSFAGTVSLYHGQPTIIVPIFGPHHTGKIIAIYPETQGLTSKWFRKTIQNYLPLLNQKTSDPLPSSLRRRHHLIHLKKALNQIHQPSDLNSLTSAQIRLKLQEILTIQVQSYLQKQKWQQLSPRFTLNTSPQINRQIKSFINSLPFQLTACQKKAWRQIKTDLLNPQKPANRLLQGDVGSGKTIVALLACFLAHLNHRQSLLLAPTEILAKQHFQTCHQFLPQVPICLLTAASKPKKIPANSIIVSTHAAIYRKSQIDKQIALLVIDEQHKFGVKQRAFLSSSLNPPHTLTMTATPIPRTIHLTLLGNLDLTILKTMPKNRLPIKTFLVPSFKKLDCYRWTEKQITQKKQQAFIVCPFIEPSETLESVKSAKRQFQILSQNIFPHLKLALIHGRTPPKTRQEIIQKFQKNKIHILVTTPIIEVGIDIPNAAIIIIQSADRFGLAQLHQLRGRVGRGHQQSYCFFFTESQNPKALSRLKFLQKHQNGLEIANFDLKTRGPGEAFSTLQHGFPSLKLASLSDTKIIKFGAKIIKDLVQNYPKFKLEHLVSVPTASTSVSAAN